MENPDDEEHKVEKREDMEKSEGGCLGLVTR